MITEWYVRKILKGVEQGDGTSFFEHVDDRVDWIVEGSHPLAGHCAASKHCGQHRGLS